ncbi:hypothetical protein M438DRAFT_342198 [Aureobasidium pullulans EXF-150]|uniref:Uncharacterized protein n=1 Tax=Aureobasidium pullulans EXF-150 TaxID=1043002 RepID=A0A074YP88_AURPU|nr:uncharacterized protein M438DRAFT_342198 [Aureobasidium pullulans EXF-150]KEQ88626.1 hypothetical protein M438DRAFT_342198 [Aureobasidium pullulans EXF-150]
MRAKALDVTAKDKPSRRQATRRTSQPKIERTPLSESKTIAKQGTNPTDRSGKNAGKNNSFCTVEAWPV